MGGADNDISTDANTQPNHLHDPSVIASSMTTSGADGFKSGESERISETETRPEMQSQYHRSSTEKAIPHHPSPLIIPRASANTSQLPDSPSNISYPMSPSLPSSRPPAVPTPTPISATQTEPHFLIQSLLPTADSDNRVQPITTIDTTLDMISPNTQRNSPSSLELSAYRDNGNLTKRISGGKSNQLEVKDIHDGSLDASIPLPASSKTPLINTKTRPSSLPYKQSPSSYDSSLFSLFFCCTRTGHSSSLSSGQPQPSPTTNVTPTSNSQSPTSSGTAGRVFDHGNTGSALGSLARFLPTMSRKGKENGKEMKSTNEGKEQAKLLQKPGNFRKVSATNAGKAQNASPGRIENQGTGKIDSPSHTSGSPRDPTVNIITSVSPGKPAAGAAAAARRRNSVFGHQNRPGKTMLKPLDAEDMGKKCLVLDLDETLVHSSFKMIAQADYVVPVEIDSTVHNVYVLKRPGVDTFLKKVGELFEVVVFTASLAKYADPVLDMLDKHKVVKHRLFRESCYNHKGNYVKDLSQLGRDIRSVIIIDNSPTSYIFHPKNAVPITSWFNDPLDTELMDLMPFLEDLTMVENVTVVLDQGG